MNTLKRIWLALLKTGKLVCLLPQKFTAAVQQRRQQAILNEREAERLDRIRNPAKYLGK